VVPDQGTASVLAAWVDAQGRVVESTQPGNLRLSRMAYELAFENWRTQSRRRSRDIDADQDILESTAIAANAPLGRKPLDTLAVRLTNVDLTGFELAGDRQSVRGETLVVVRERPDALRPDYTLPGGREHRQRFRAALAAEPLIQSASWPIVSLAVRIAGEDKDPRVVAEKINRWVHDSLEKEITVGIPSALQVLEARSGDCNEHATLYVALARALGIPSRVAAGLAFVNGKFYYHAWPEIYLDRWVAVDPTFGQFPADAAHLRFVTGGLSRQAELLRLIGALEIDVVRAR
jgi:hypothetical protein